MKPSLTRRRLVLAAIAAIGVYLTLALFSEEEMPVRQWVLTRLAYAGIVAASYLSFRYLNAKWGSEADHHEITNKPINKSYGNQN